MSGRAFGHKICSFKIPMKDNIYRSMPAQTSPGQTRSALPSPDPGGSEKSARGARLRIGSANVGTMSRRSGEVTEMARRRRLDFCCLQETRWRGEGARTLGSYKFFAKAAERDCQESVF